MATRIVDRDGNRVLSIDASNADCPGSVFITGPRGFCMEFHLADLVSGFKNELGIVESLDVSMGRYLQTAA